MRVLAAAGRGCGRGLETEQAGNSLGQSLVSLKAGLAGGRVPRLRIRGAGRGLEATNDYRAESREGPGGVGARPGCGLGSLGLRVLDQAVLCKHWARQH